MKSLLSIILLFTFAVSCTNSNKTEPQKPLSGNIPNDLRMLLPAGKVKVDIMDSVIKNARYEELVAKFMSAIKKNYDWYIDYVQTNPENEPMPYHPNLGITKEEYAELSAMKEYGEVVSSGTEEMEISITDTLIRFRSNNKLAGLDSLQIDLRSNVVSFGNMKLTFMDTVTFSDELNPMKSKGKGYSWKFRKLSDLSVSNPKDTGAIGITNYEFMIGRLEKNGKTYMIMKGGELNGGVKSKAVELPVMF